MSNNGDKTSFIKALFLGIVGSFFFAFTFVLNRRMNLGGGYWLWNASLRYLFTLPITALIISSRGGTRRVWAQISKRPIAWLVWSTIGFGLFYAPLSLASVYAESWFTASSWQITIVCGVLLTPLLGNKLPRKNLLCSLVILVGIAIMQYDKIRHGFDRGFISAAIMILVAAFAYPLGNRKMMDVVGNKLTTMERVFGMTLCSIPFWCVASGFAYAKVGLPSGSQVTQSLLVAVFSGVIATVLFFRATDIVRKNPRKLAVIEATQSGEVIFTLLLGVLMFKDTAPNLTSIIGIVVVVLGMIISSIIA